MKTQVSGSVAQFKFPQTQVHSLLSDQLLIFLRSWNGIDANQKVIDEINHFLSAADADLEVTTPFEFIIYKTENKESYSHGFEIAIVYKHQQEIAWSTVGRFEILATKNKKNISLGHGGQFLDDQVLLPVALLGIEREPAVLTGSLSIKNLEQIQVVSEFDQSATSWKALVTDFS
jgi:hypothetical protein